ncbi:hypothetical protein UB46_26990 [Burkholderiaceae bacterium 16]|nr:hypothetical protein UB46_26990 [Burkholderiaceae bacterium 16]
MSLQFVFDYRSPYSYLADTQVRTWEADIDYRPVDIGAVMKKVNNQPSPACPPKARYAVADARRWAEHYGVPFAPNMALIQAMNEGRFDGAMMSRAALVAQEIGVFQRVHEALYEAVWTGTDDLSTAEGRRAFLDTRGIDAHNLWERASSPPILESMASLVDEVAQRGAFGVPFFFVGDHMFFGNDRLNFVKAQLQSQPLEGARA